MFDHEEEVVQATVANESGVYLFGSIDREGCVIVRDLRQPDYETVQIKPELEETVDTACIAFNNFHLLQSGLRNREDLFVAINNQLYVYCLHDQKQLDHAIYNGNIISIRQNKGTLLLVMDDDSIITYDFRKQA